MSSFNPHTHEGCDQWQAAFLLDFAGFNPHTHEGCDKDIANKVTDIVTFQSTHPRRVWHIDEEEVKVFIRVSIHTPTKGVTHKRRMVTPQELFQSTHPRRVWHSFSNSSLLQSGFNPHTHEGCDTASMVASSMSTGFNPHTHEGCDSGSR